MRLRPNDARCSQAYNSIRAIELNAVDPNTTLLTQHTFTYSVSLAHSKSSGSFCKTKSDFQSRLRFSVCIMPKYGQLNMSPEAKVINRCLDPHNLVAVEFHSAAEQKIHVHTHTHSIHH